MKQMTNRLSLPKIEMSPGPSVFFLIWCLMSLLKIQVFLQAVPYYTYYVVRTIKYHIREQTTQILTVCSWYAEY